MGQEKTEERPNRAVALDRGSTPVTIFVKVFTIIPFPLLLNSQIIFTPLVSYLAASVEASEVLLTLGNIWMEAQAARGGIMKREVCFSTCRLLINGVCKSGAEQNYI